MHILNIHYYHYYCYLLLLLRNIMNKFVASYEMSAFSKSNTKTFFDNCTTHNQVESKYNILKEYERRRCRFTG